MKTCLLSILALLLASMPVLAGPTVSNVHASQRAGTKQVDIYYDVTSGTAALNVSVVVSKDSGANYNVAASSFTGDVGTGVAAGSNRHIVWNAGTDWDGQVSSGVRFRVTASDGAAPVAGMVLIPAGSFSMGDSFTEGYSDERPVHTVYVSAFYMQATETTKAQWDDVANWAASNGYDINAAGGSGKASNHPVYYVTWYECVKYCNARSQKEGLTPCYTVSGTTYKAGSSTPDCNWSANGYRLPTEAEWEKAARGGVSGKRFPWGDTINHSYANYYNSTYSYESPQGVGYHPTYNDGVSPYTSSVGSFEPNGYGLYDMAGNVWEWCNDWYSSGYYATADATTNNPRGASSGSNRVVRGGSWSVSALYCSAAGRGNCGPGSIYDYVGFRPARSSVP